MKKLLSLMTAAMALVSCSQSKENGTAESCEHAPKTLVLYYSQNGTTAKVANEIVKQASVDNKTIDMAEIKVKNGYDGDFNETIDRCKQEMADGILPELDSIGVNINDYDVIFLGYPIWFGTYAPPVASFLKENNLAGKTVYPFMTFGSGGRVRSTQELSNACPEAKIGESFAIRTARIAAVEEEVSEYLTNIGHKQVSTTDESEYGETHEVSDEERAIFDQACGSYQFPLGVPVTVAILDAGNTTKYFFVSVRDNDTLCIPVVQGKAEGSVAEFTEVLR